MTARHKYLAHVRAAGGCWIQATMASFGLCDHIYTPEDKIAENDAFFANPSAMDQRREGYLRDAVGNCLAKEGASKNVVDEVRKRPVYLGPRIDDNYVAGGYGTEVELKVLSRILKTSIIIIDKDNLDVQTDDISTGATCMIYDIGTGTVTPMLWNRDEVDHHELRQIRAQTLCLLMSKKRL